jgi:hypothetical protein
MKPNMRIDAILGNVVQKNSILLRKLSVMKRQGEGKAGRQTDNTQYTELTVTHKVYQ